MSELDQNTEAHVQEWLQEPFDRETRAAVQALQQRDQGALRDAFYTTLTFGTGGLRGIMGVGTNRMNRYTVQMATQGLANYLLKQPKKNTHHTVFIGFDSRHNSTLFALEAARVLAGNGIKVYLLTEMRPTPFVSFACRYKQCSAAIMITASHNPPEYNGYKVYWSDGAQVVPPHDVGIMEEARAIRSLDQISVAPEDHPLIERIEKTLDTAYLSAIFPLQLYRQSNRAKGKELRIVYTSLHGTGITLVPPALQSWGFSQISYVKEQVRPDGDFPTVKSPNPEQKAALQMGIDQLLIEHADLLIATDPDADRMGAVVLHQGEAVILTGNEIAALCVEHICHALTEAGTMPTHGAFVTTIVTTELLKTIASHYQRPCFEVLTGFKYIGEKIHEWETFKGNYQFLFGAEESYGYLLGTIARDKDAVSSSCLIAEIALQAKLHGITLVDTLHRLYRKYGVFREKQLSLEFALGKEGQNQIANLMTRLRKQPSDHFCHREVTCIEDYALGTKIEKGKTTFLTLPRSDVLLFRLKEGGKIVIRPSGTEPKLKIYASIRLPPSNDVPAAIVKADQELDKLLSCAREEIL